MNDILNPSQWVFAIGDASFALNAETVVMSLFAALALVLLSYAASRRVSMVPNILQNSAEMFVEGFFDLTSSSLGARGSRYFALIATTFLYILISNWMGVAPYLSEPTRDLNTTLALALIGFSVAHYSAIRVKGFKGYVKAYFEPFFLIFPLNVIGELAKVVSLSFRLYGNIMGGAVIILVVSDLVRQLVLPPLMMIFFGFFVGTVQAFVFAMLTLTYISLAVRD